ncbi:hypothetical protein REH81_01570 [Vibrio rotiferianus]
MTAQQLMNCPVIGLKPIAKRPLISLAILAGVYVLKNFFYGFMNFPSIGLDIAEGKTDYLTYWKDSNSKLAGITHYIYGNVFMLLTLGEILAFIGTTTPYLALQNQVKNTYNKIVDSRFWQWFSRSKYFCIASGLEAGLGVMVALSILLFIVGMLFVAKGESNFSEMLNRLYSLEVTLVLLAISAIAVLFATCSASMDRHTKEQKAAIEAGETKVLSIDLKIGSTGDFYLIYQTETGSVKAGHRGNAKTAVITYLEEYAKLNDKTLPDWIYQAADLDPESINHLNEITVDGAK